MDAALVILKQLVIMAIYCAIGFILHRTNKVGKEGCRAFSTLLLYVILPAVIIESFQKEATPETTSALVQALIVSVLLVIITMAFSWALSHFFLKKDPICEIATAFSNAGFMGIPLIRMMLGSDAVFYVAAFIALINIAQWTYGQYIIGGKSANFKFTELLLNPLIVAVIVGLILYFLPITLPQQLRTCITGVASCNSPIAMIILGYYLSELPMKRIFTVPAAYLVSLTRLAIIPVVSLFVIAVMPGISADIKTALLIAASAPVGINVAVYAQRLDKDYPLAVVLICHSTLLCVISMPLMMALSSRFF